MSLLRARAHAKVNLGLRVLGRRADGYHELRTTLQTISLADTISFEPAEDISLQVTGPYPVPAGDDNLVLRAARLLARELPGHGARILLEKRIPPGSGLGGGSSDAAVTLMGLARLWEAALEPHRLDALARQLGSDVPFFLYGGTCLAVGRGEEILPLPDLPAWPILVAWPGEGLSTAEIYATLPESLTRQRILSSMKGFVPPPPGGTGEAAEPPDLTNDLETTAIRRLPALERLRERLVAGGAQAVAMSGSGSAVFGLFPGESRLERLAASLSAAGAHVFACHLVPRETYRGTLFERS